MLAGPWPSKQNGIVVGSGEWTSFEDRSNSSRLDSAAAAASLSSAKSVGVNAVEFIPTWLALTITGALSLYLC